ncbi:Hypothetical protein ORPV_335 [Orpheovirus IHUMI-LCC2]|uniref:Uncharacterized protein n=1 Tax=Orpheovirus IHUMI-LCC2 TaxID=2023057 RepID=A0A2I2L450_9VIRU|nr:Hypothetical protein ORPV_335 [Orpheovirus IHUMI-LCC2]SNW62239.1 Hypothetical protein ORPV_335 [Orpheovirus IHUMI-LCC2]
MEYKLITTQFETLYVIDEKQYNKLLKVLPNIKMLTSGSHVVIPNFANMVHSKMTKCLTRIIWGMKITLSCLELIHKLGGNFEYYATQELVLRYIWILQNFIRNKDEKGFKVDPRMNALYEPMDNLISNNYMSWKLSIIVQKLILESSEVNNVPQDLDKSDNFCYELYDHKLLKGLDGLIYKSDKNLIVNIPISSHTDSPVIIGIHDGKLYLKHYMYTKYKFIDMQEIMYRSTGSLLWIIENFPYNIYNMRGRVKYEINSVSGW